MKALLVVDIQNDFMPDGPLAVPDGHQVVPAANRLMGRFPLVVASQDWHPVNHGSFAINHAGTQPGNIIQLAGLDQILWPAHCVQHTPGAAFHPALDTRRIHHVVRKGIDPEIDSYGAFFDNGHLRPTGLDEYLKSKNVRDLYVLGLAADYCVKFTVLDALELGYHVFVVEDGCRGVNLEPDDTEVAIRQMLRAGATILASRDVRRS